MNLEALPWHLATEEDVLFLHGREMDRKSQRGTPPIPGCVQRSLSAAANAALYTAEAQETEPDLLVSTASLLFYLNKNHCFEDGNKRAAWLAVTHQLHMNGLRISVEQEAAAALVDRVAEGTVTREEVLEWFAAPGRIVAL
jgi:death on curing protein